ncbi:MAG: pyrroline-5-carboxylate reductase [Lentisphaeria bacterium]|jgi:pyrroline-5-carboxylate reductase
MKLLFVGAGKMATAIAGGLVQRQVLPAADLLAADVSPAARQAFTAATGVPCAAEAAPLAAGADAILLAVKPQVAAAAVEALAPAVRGRLVISICAGLGLAKLAGWFGHDRIVRVMPNTPLLVGLGASVFCCGAGVTAADRELVGRIFGTLGLVREQPEAKMDAVTALSGSGPAYVFEMVQGLVDAAVAAGLPAELALELTVQTVAGAAEMLRRRLGAPDELRNAVTSPGGTTAAGLAVFAQAGFRGLLKDVVAAAAARSAELGR